MGNSHSNPPGRPAAYAAPAYAGEDFRRQAQQQNELCDAAFQKSRTCYEAGDHEGAKHYSLQGKEHARQRKVLNDKAAACTFASNNAGRSDTEVDLHGLSVAEAQAKVEQVISSARSQAQGRRQPEPITFIVGQGRHSQGGEAKLKPAIASLITRHNLRCTVGHPNSGCLYVEFVTAEERGWFHRLMDKCVIS
ncbi:hypothetical protein QJQ45_019138 [Haematococcus lacustris]|nr:hypothetical protein QJQ45_019138 [Haematococcus lacustris]